MALGLLWAALAVSAFRGEEHHAHHHRHQDYQQLERYEPESNSDSNDYQVPQRTAEQAFGAARPAITIAAPLQASSAAPQGVPAGAASESALKSAFRLQKEPREREAEQFIGKMYSRPSAPDLSDASPAANATAAAEEVTTPKLDVTNAHRMETPVLAQASRPVAPQSQSAPSSPKVKVSSLISAILSSVLSSVFTRTMTTMTVEEYQEMLTSAKQKAKAAH